MGVSSSESHDLTAFYEMLSASFGVLSQNTGFYPSLDRIIETTLGPLNLGPGGGSYNEPISRLHQLVMLMSSPHLTFVSFLFQPHCSPYHFTENRSNLKEATPSYSSLFLLPLNEHLSLMCTLPQHTPFPAPPSTPSNPSPST